MIRRLLTTLAAALAGIQALVPAALAQAAEPATAGGATAGGFIGLAAGLGIGLAAFGGALGQGRAVASALDGIARNPSASGKIQTPMIIGLALIESLVIYALVIAFLLQGKI
jgi:F-type H+-transporting ATPase subunit c